jgi:hypothetical protein
MLLAACPLVVAGLVPAIHVFGRCRSVKDVNARLNAAHDGTGEHAS